MTNSDEKDIKMSSMIATLSKSQAREFGKNAESLDYISGKWIKTIVFEEGFIRKMLITKRPKQERAELI